MNDIIHINIIVYMYNIKLSLENVKMEGPNMQIRANSHDQS